MNKKLALGIFESLRYSDILDKQEESEFIESSEYLCTHTDDPIYPVTLGGYYYESKVFDKALKYYLEAKDKGDHWANIGLGYIYYYGRVDEPNYKLAYKYYKEASLDKDADPYTKAEATLKIADMYKNGYHVKQSYDKYVKLVESLIENLESYPNLKVEIYTRLASIRKDDGNKVDALLYLRCARYELEYRLSHNRFFGDLTRMKWLINDLYSLIKFNPSSMNLYDLYYLLKHEHVITFRCNGRKYTITSKLNNKEMNIKFKGKVYKNIDEFFSNACITINGAPFTIEHLYRYLTDWVIVL